MIIFLLNTVFTLLCLWGPVMSDVLLSRLIPSQNMQAAAECREHQARLVNARKNIFIHGYFNFYQAGEEKAAIHNSFSIK